MFNLKPCSYLPCPNGHNFFSQKRWSMWSAAYRPNLFHLLSSARLLRFPFLCISRVRSDLETRLSANFRWSFWLKRWCWRVQWSVIFLECLRPLASQFHCQFLKSDRHDDLKRIMYGFTLFFYLWSQNAFISYLDIAVVHIGDHEPTAQVVNTPWYLDDISQKCFCV